VIGEIYADWGPKRPGRFNYCRASLRTTLCNPFAAFQVADVQNLHICCFHSGPEISVLSLSPFPQHFPGHFSVGISLPLACICLPFRFGTICHWQAVILWLVSWVCLPVCPASLWTPTSARVDFKGSLAGFRAPRTLRLSVSRSFLSVSLSHL